MAKKTKNNGDYTPEEKKNIMMKFVVKMAISLVVLALAIWALRAWS
ncbi:MAG: hypothetical protein ACI4EW_01515 [Butyrivibrio sp.]